MTSVDIEKLLLQLTLEEKISLIAGASTWRTAAVPRLGIPNLKVSDGPSGARGEIFGEGVPAAFLPSGVSLGATWDVDLLFEVGQLLAEECKTKSAAVSLAPTMCIHRHPLGGRNFESFSEDPLLTGKLATAHIRGLQSRGVGATPKHFVANDQETDRFQVDCIIPERALREVYLRPFQMVVRDADPWCMMTSYNKINGHHADASKELLTDIVRNEWGWDGVFMSDWGGTNSCAASIDAGLNLEMGGPPLQFTADKVLKAIQEGSINEGRIDFSVRRILQLLVKTGRFVDSSDNPEYCNNSSETQKFLLKAATSGIVMLKNQDEALPIKPSEGLKKLAVVGPNAQRIVAGGGGSAYIKAPYWTSVYDSLKAQFEGTQTEIHYNVGARVNRYLPTMSNSVAHNPDTGKGGAKLEWFLGHDLAGPVQAVTSVEDLYYISFGDRPPEISAETGFSIKLHTVLKPDSTGIHKLSFASIGPAKLYIDEELVVELSGKEKGTLFFTYGSNETIIERYLVAGQEYHILAEYQSHDRQLSDVAHLDPMEEKFQGMRLGYQEADTTDLPGEAAKLAADCDAAVVVVGRDKEWETEGQDIPMFELPGEQVRLIQEVASVCKRTIVIIQAGTPVNMLPWINQVQGVLYTWYQGQELGSAAASIICGLADPSGRLPITFPERIEDCPAYSSFPGENGEILYSEGLFVGYKWWDLLDRKPLFSIGYGLSYNNFEMFDQRLSSSLLQRDGPVIASVAVRSCGSFSVSGRETIIAWVSERTKGRLHRPKKQICGFARSPLLHPGETGQVNISIDAYALAVYDPAQASWVIDKGTEFDILLGRHAQEVSLVGTITVPEEITFAHLL